MAELREERGGKEKRGRGKTATSTAWGGNEKEEGITQSVHHRQS